MDRIEMMQAFLAVAQEGSFTAGARRLGVSTKLASKRVAALESRLGAQLFARTTRSVTLTDAGDAYRARAAPLVEQFGELDDALRERQSALAGQIRVTAPTAFGSQRLPGALAAFMAAHPQVSVQLQLTNARIDLVAEGFDLAVRVGAPGDSSLIGRRLAATPLVVCAAPAYLARAGTPLLPAELAAHDCLIDESFAEPTTWRFRAALPGDDRSAGAQEAAVRVSGRLRANAPAPLAEFAVAGMGIARAPAYIVAEAVADGRLTALLQDFPAIEIALYALYPPNRHMPARVRALIDHLARHFGAARWAQPAGRPGGGDDPAGAA
ncbi:LysR family transcriptional regulator [Rubrimonas cliftonensis]|uniref:Transcriptional regulator, LysR family n=1 Tax=Rubrimonas cliftonensis TaxID=89524 RepID=A0A1H4EJR6_9RHOB|nr:LysR family transcriptional regulator [Rubrimonas cliftonensis]SEA85283.1 transcriptional regulator, LysR family [Rubrimonas cliftonensis]